MNERTSIARITALATLVLLWLFAAVPFASAAPAPSGRRVVLLDLHDTLQPVRARVFNRQIEDANDTGASAIFINLSTPGGMSKSTDSIIATMRASRIPIIVWEGLPDTRITGEGLRILAEADVALMGPHTYLTPMWTERPRGLTPEERTLGSQQLLENLAASVSSHGRNPSALDELTSGVHWFTGPEAAQAGFIDGLAPTEAVALAMAQQRLSTATTRGGPVDLSTLPAQRVGTRTRDVLLLALMNPDLAVLLLTLGLLLIYLEVNTPGIVVPGAAGVLLVLLACLSLSTLPLSVTGVLLNIAAVLMLLLEARRGYHGILAGLGVAALVGGLGLMVDGPLPELEVSWATAIGAGIGFGGVTATLIVLGLEARRAKVKTGSEAMLGWLAVAQTPLTPEGQVLVRGELWRARLTSSDSIVAAGDRVKVLRADGLILEVTAVPLG